MTPDDLTPAQREEAQEVIAKIWLMRHVPFQPERRRSVHTCEQVITKPHTPWLRPWRENDVEWRQKRLYGTPVDTSHSR